MNKNNSRLFGLITFVSLILIFCFGLFFIAPDSNVAFGTFLATGSHILKVLIKIVLIFIFTLIFGFLYFKFILGIPLSSLKAKFGEDNNDSHTWIICGIAVSLAVAFTMAGGSNLRQYLFQLCTKATAGYFIAIIITLILTRMVGVKSVNQFRSWIDRPNNDSYAIYVFFILVGSLLVSMS